MTHAAPLSIAGPPSVEQLHDYGTLEEIERRVILDRMTTMKNNQGHVAASLGISIRAIGYKLAAYRREESR